MYIILGGIIMITEKDYLMEIEKYNKFLFFISIGIIAIIVVFGLVAISMGIASESGSVSDVAYKVALALVFLVNFILLALSVAYIIFAIFQIIAAFRESEKKETSMYKVFSITSIIGLTIISPIVIFFLLRSDLKKLDEK